MDFQTAVNKMKEAAIVGDDLCAVRPAWLQEAAEMAAYCFCPMFESDYICLTTSPSLDWEGIDEDEKPEGDVFYTNDLIDNDETREATDFMLFDEPPCASYSADGTEVCVSIDPVEKDSEVLNDIT